MGCRAQPVRYPISRTVQQMTRETRMGQPSYTEFRILPLKKVANQHHTIILKTWSGLSSHSFGIQKTKCLSVPKIGSPASFFLNSEPDLNMAAFLRDFFAHSWLISCNLMLVEIAK